MEVKQIAELMNSVTREVLGETAIQTEDLSNVVDIGTAIFNASSVDNFVKSLVSHIGRVIFVNRPYTGSAPSVLMDGWEFGSVLEKIHADIPEAEDNESWELTDRTVYEQDMFYKPSVTVKFFDFRTTMEVPYSITEKQVKSAFSSATQLNGFISMLYNAVDRSMTIKLDALIMETIAAAMGETINDEFSGGTGTGDSSGVKAINLLYLYNQTVSTPITAATACSNPDFIRFASYQMGLTADRMKKLSRLFNVGGKDRFTAPDMLHVVLLSDFSRAADAFLQSGTYHDKFTALPKHEVVPFWQASGTGYAFDDTSAIKIKLPSDNTTTIYQKGILGVMFDRDALGVTNMDRRTTTHYNAKAEFWNYWSKMDAGYFVDLDENCVVFYIEDATSSSNTRKK